MKIKFWYKGELVDGYILAQDSDPTCHVWVAFASDPDKDAFILPSAIVK